MKIFKFFLLMPSLFLFSQSIEASVSCTQVFSKKIVSTTELAHPYISTELKTFRDYNQFAQAITEGFRVRKDQFDFLKNYFNKYFSPTTNGRYSEEQMERLMLVATDPDFVKEQQFAEALINIQSELLSRPRSSNELLTRDEIKRLEWLQGSNYLRLRPLSALEVAFARQLEGENMPPATIELLADKNRASYQSPLLEWNHAFTLTNQKNESLGVLYLSIEQLSKASGHSNSSVAVLHSVHGVPLEALDSVLAALHQVLKKQNLDLALLDKYKNANGFIDLPVNEAYQMPFTFMEKAVKTRSRFTDIEPLNLKIVQTAKSSNNYKLTQKTKSQWSVENLDVSMIHQDFLAKILNSSDVKENLSFLSKWPEFYQEQKIQKKYSDKLLESIIYNFDKYEFEVRFQALMAYFDVQSFGDYKMWSDTSLLLFDRFWPLISSFDQKEIPKVLSKISKYINNGVILDKFMRDLNGELIRGFHERLDAETYKQLTVLIDGALPLVGKVDTLDLSYVSAVGVFLGASYANKIRSNDLEFIRILLENGLEPTRGLAVALGQKILDPNFKISVEMVELFISFGADVNYNLGSVMFSNGMIGFGGIGVGDHFLSSVIGEGRLDLVKVFINNKADTNIKIDTYDHETKKTNTYSLIEFADKYGHADIAKYLRSIN